MMPNVTMLTDLLFKLRVYDARGYRPLLELELDELWLKVVDALMRDFLVPSLSEKEADLMVGLSLGVSL